MTKKVVIIEDDELFREGLKRIVNTFQGFEVEITSDSSGICEIFSEQDIMSKVDLVIINPPVDFKKYVKILKLLRPFQAMIMSNLFSKQRLMRAIENGVSAFYTKKLSITELHQVIEELTLGNDFSDIKMDATIKSVLTQKSIDEFSFTKQEIEVLNLVCDQKSSAEIADFLGVSIRTVESRKRNMMVKTNSKNMVGVVVIYLNYLNQSIMR